MAYLCCVMPVWFSRRDSQKCQLCSVVSSRQDFLVQRAATSGRRYRPLPRVEMSNALGHCRSRFSALRPLRLQCTSANRNDSGERNEVPLADIRSALDRSTDYFSSEDEDLPEQADPSLSMSDSPSEAARPPWSMNRPSGASRLSWQNNAQHSWLESVATLPLAAAATAAKTNDHYLAKRNRSQWWRRQDWPKVPADTLEDAKLPEPPAQLWHKLLPLALIFFTATFNLTVLQNLKDAIVVTSAGAEVLPFLASFCVLPASIGFFMYYNKIVSALPGRFIFAAAMAPLVGFYVLFAAVLYPAHTSLHPHGLYSALAPYFPVGLHGLIKVVEQWTFSAFFCTAELWGSVVISVLFWTLANEVCTVAEAKTIYPLVGVFANLALVVAGNFTKYVNKQVAHGSTLLSLRWLVGTVVLLTVLMWAAKAYVDQAFGVADGSGSGAGTKSKTKSKKKSSFGETLATLRSSPKIAYLAILVMAYGLSHRVFDVAWKSELRALYPSPQAYQGVLADVSIATGYLTMALMVSGKFVFQHLGWGVAAAATPLVMLSAGVAFFGLALASRFGWAVPGVSSAALAMTGVTAGIVTQVFARSAKFSLFDPAKEMVYIEMDKEEKSRGKAAVDLLGSQIGKSGASWLTQALLLGLGSIAASMPLLGAVYGVVILLWLRAVSGLAGEIKEHERRMHEQAAAKEAGMSVPEGEAAASPLLGTVPHAADNGTGGYNRGQQAFGAAAAAETGPGVVGGKVVPGLEMG